MMAIIYCCNIVLSFRVLFNQVGNTYSANTANRNKLQGNDYDELMWYTLKTAVSSIIEYLLKCRERKSQVAYFDLRGLRKTFILYYVK